MARPTSSATNKLKAAAGRLTGITAHDGFLGHETLLTLVMSDETRQVLDSLANERLRAFRDEYRDFSAKSQRLLQRGDRTRLQALYTDWMRTCQAYFGYADFAGASTPHPEAGAIPYRAAEGDTHTVAVFFACHPDTPLRAFDSGPLTDDSGQVLFKSSRQEPLTEQVERALKGTGMADAVLLMPHGAYYFRSDTQTAGSCLEARWDEIMASGRDDALALATYLLRASFFAYGSQASEDAAADGKRPGDDDESGDEGEEDGASGGGNVRMTPSSQLFREDLEHSRAITEELHRQVVLALEVLINERLAVDKELAARARSAKHNDAVAQELFKNGLFVLYRILFVLYAEARGFLPLENRQFASFYSLEHLRGWSEEFLRKSRRGVANAGGTYVWGALQSIFTLLRRGVVLSGDQLVSPFNGQLFAGDRAPLFDGCPPLRDQALARVITVLTRLGGEASGRKLHFANLGVEQLGAVYESLLAQKPVVVREPMVWVPAHGGGVGLVTEALADQLDMSRFDEEASGGRQARRATKGKKPAGGRSGALASAIDPSRPGYDPTVGKFIVAPLGGAKRQTASFYTPPKLADFLVRRTLAPLVKGKSAAEIKALKIVEPAMGSGGFVIATVRYLASELLKAKMRDPDCLELRGVEKPDFRHLQRCKREIIESSIFGVDINPLAIELARTSLYLEALVPGEPLPFLHHRLKSGNSLIGADLQGRALSTWDDGQEFPMLFDLPIQHIKVKDEVWDAWDAAYPEGDSATDLKAQAAETIKARKAERKKLSTAAWTTWATGAQTKVEVFLRKAQKALVEFEKTQSSGAVVDALDERHKDHITHIPDMDPVLIEAYGIDIDPALLQKRRKALLTELGEKTYNAMVARQRAFYRLRALGDLATALWYWPLDEYQRYPTHASFQELCDWLLDERTLERKAKGKPLSKGALKSLRIALTTARRIGAFHWDVEFAQVFGGLEKPGFDCLISNPPWKVVGVKDKTVYPHFDPQFLSTKPAKKKERIAALYCAEPEAAATWYEESFLSSHMTEHWRKGSLGEIEPVGQVDLCVLFVLRAERLARKGGRTGLIVSRTSLFINKASKNVRERFFKEWGLEEAMSFVNRLGIFAIASFTEFSLLVGQHLARRQKPRFVHGLVDPNSLDVVARNLEVRDVGAVTSGPRPAELSLETIGKYFSKESLSIPGITDQRQIDVVMGLHDAAGPVVYLDEINAITKKGIDQTVGVEKGFAEHASSIKSSELPSWSDVVAGKKSRWVPLVRGRDFNLFDGFRAEKVPEIQRYTRREVLEHAGIEMGRKVIFWRDISRIGAQRTLIASLATSGVWVDNTCAALMGPNDEATEILAACLSFIGIDYLVRHVGSTHVTIGMVRGLPIPAYRSVALDGAIVRMRKAYLSRDATEKRQNQAEFDALMWLHYGMGRGRLTRDSLEWLLSSQFSCLDRNDPEYKTVVLAAYDGFIKEGKYQFGGTGALFSKAVVSIATSSSDHSDSPTTNRAAARRRRGA